MMDSAMQTEALEILQRAKAAMGPPPDWVVFPLLRHKLLLALVGWALGIVFGLGLFGLLAAIVIPYNYEHGIGPALFSTLLLGFPLFLGLGSIWALWADLRRLQAIEAHVLVITPNAFVKQEGQKIIYVPLMYVRHVTARGSPLPERDVPTGPGERARPHAGDNLSSSFLGRAFTPTGLRQAHRRMRTPTKLAFIDSRSEEEVTVVTDGAYGDPFTIAALLKQYAARAQHIA